MKRCIVALFLLGAPAYGQRDFLTTNEVDQVREMQDPNDRLKLYLSFAEQRLDQVKSLMSKEKPGRSLQVHDLLDEYLKILDAIDTVSDDALKRKLNIEIGNTAVAQGERTMLKVLEQVANSHPKDQSRYEFVLKQAIDSTNDSLELASQDLTTRSTEVAAKEAQEKKEIESTLEPKERAERKAVAQKEEDQNSQRRKPPTLLKKGETLSSPPKQ